MKEINSLNYIKTQSLRLSFFVLLLYVIGCDTTEPPDNPPIVPTTEVEGPGGNAYISGFIKDYVHPTKAVSNTNIFIMNQEDYCDTILHVFVNSTDASFNITKLPEERVDLIFLNENYLCAKIGKLNMQANGNSFYNPNSSGFFIDSTIYITNIADSVGRPNAPVFGLQGYDSGLVVSFKWETADSVAWEIVSSSGCDTLRVYRYNDPVFDPYENDVYVLKCPTVKSVIEKLRFFNWFKEVYRAGHIFQVVQP